MALSKTEAETIETGIEILVEKALMLWDQLAGRMNLEKAICDIGTQADWDGRSYGGNSGRDAGVQMFAGGIQESVLKNLLYTLSLDTGGMRHSSGLLTIAAVALKRAMTLDNSLREFVEAVLRGIEIVGKDLENENERRIYDVLVQGEENGQ